MFTFEKYFRVSVDRVIDGDTLDVSFYLGLGIWLNKQRVRLRGINAPEMRGDEREQGQRVTDYLTDALAKAESIIVKTDESSKGKYGRFLVVVYIRLNGKWVNVNSELIKQGAAREYMATEMSQETQKEVFDPPPEDLESRVEVDEQKTESEVYNEGEGVVEELVTLARKVMGRASPSLVKKHFLGVVEWIQDMVSSPSSAEGLWIADGIVTEVDKDDWPIEVQIRGVSGSVDYRDGTYGGIEDGRRQPLPDVGFAVAKTLRGKTIRVNAKAGFVGPRDRTPREDEGVEGSPAVEQGQSVYEIVMPVTLAVKVTGAKYRNGELMIRADIRG